MSRGSFREKRVNCGNPPGWTTSRLSRLHRRRRRCSRRRRCHRRRHRRRHRHLVVQVVPTYSCLLAPCVVVAASPNDSKTGLPLGSRTGRTKRKEREQEETRERKKDRKTERKKEREKREKERIIVKLCVLIRSRERKLPKYIKDKRLSEILIDCDMQKYEREEKG